jgi:hypothetical protein
MIMLMLTVVLCMLLLTWRCRKEVDGQATLLGFVGTPWTLAAYAMEGKADRDCKQTKVRSSAAAAAAAPVRRQLCSMHC